MATTLLLTDLQTLMDAVFLAQRKYTPTTKCARLKYFVYLLRLAMLLVALSRRTRTSLWALLGWRFFSGVGDK